MILGITGSIGTGKTTVSKMFEKKGAYRIDADRLAHEAVEKGRVPYRSVVRFFGREILHKDGTIDRQRLSRIVFKSPKKLRKLNAFIHPYVIHRMKQKIRNISHQERNPCIVVEAPLLHEAQLTGLFDSVVTVSCKGAVQRARWLKQGRCLKELRERSSSQLPLSYKKKHADFVVDNSGSTRNTRAQVDHIWKVIEDTTCDISNGTCWR